MSAGYNDRLKPISWKGECGDKERDEPRMKWSKKAIELVDWMQKSKFTVAFTGAGISTSCGIPDFRGPKGVWTLEKKGLKVDESECVSFEAAKPSFTHMALLALMKRGYLHYIVSQNVDGLHLKSGIPRTHLSELHGNMFAEVCDACGAEYHRAFDVGGMGYRPTGRNCERDGCGHPLRDFCCDWDSELPEAEFSRAIDAHKKADVALCLGTSLRIRPAGNMPLRTLNKHKKDAPGKLVICNLQKTHLDRSASLRFFVRCDALMREVCQLLDVAVDYSDPLAEAAHAKAQAEEAATPAAAATVKVKKEPKVKPEPIPPANRPARERTQVMRAIYQDPFLLMKREEEQTAAAAAASSASSASLLTSVSSPSSSMQIDSIVASSQSIGVKRTREPSESKEEARRPKQQKRENEHTETIQTHGQETMLD